MMSGPLPVGTCEMKSWSTVAKSFVTILTSTPVSSVNDFATGSIAGLRSMSTQIVMGVESAGVVARAVVSAAACAAGEHERSADEECADRQRALLVHLHRCASLKCWWCPACAGAGAPLKAVLRLAESCKRLHFYHHPPSNATSERQDRYDFVTSAHIREAAMHLVLQALVARPRSCRRTVCPTRLPAWLILPSTS